MNDVFEKFKNSDTPMRIGLIMGSFDPFHYGHMSIIQNVLEKGVVDFVWVLPTPQNPFKQHAPVPLEHRIEIINRHIRLHAPNQAAVLNIFSQINLDAIDDVDYGYRQLSLVNSTIKIFFDLFHNDEYKITYSQGIRWSALKEKPTLHVILGTDAFDDLPKWKNFNTEIEPLIGKAYHFIKYTRYSGTDDAEWASSTHGIPHETVTPDISLQISSTVIRKRMYEELPCSMYMEGSAIVYCRINDLYYKPRPTVKELTRQRCPELTDAEFESRWEKLNILLENHKK